MRVWYAVWRVRIRDFVSALRKITINVPEDLLEKAVQITGQGVTETIRQSLTLLSARQSYRELLKMRGKVKFSINLKKLRED